MSEPKYIYKPVPCPVYRVEAFQSWLEDLAREGLILLKKDSILLGIATFTRQAPQPLRYRLEPTPKAAGSTNDYDTPDHRAVEMNEAFGWEYVTRYGQFYIYRCADPHAPELHTDPQLQELSLKALKKRTRNALLWSILNLLFLGWLNLGCILTIAAAFLGTLLIAGGLLLVLESFLSRLYELIHLKKLCDKMKQGQSPTGQADWKKGRFLFRVKRILEVILPLLWFIACFTSKADGEYLLQDYDKPLPFATLEQVFPEEEVILDDAFVDSDIILYSDILIPETMEYSFYGDVRFDRFDTAYAYIHVNYHRTVSPRIARQLAKEYVWHATRQDLFFFRSDWSYYDVSGVEADYITCFNQGYNVILILAKGNEIIRCTYRVNGHDTDAEIARFAQVMAASLG